MQNENSSKAVQCLKKVDNPRAGLIVHSATRQIIAKSSQIISRQYPEMSRVC